MGSRPTVSLLHLYSAAVGMLQHSSELTGSVSRDIRTVRQGWHAGIDCVQPTQAYSRLRYLCTQQGHIELQITCWTCLACQSLCTTPQGIRTVVHIELPCKFNFTHSDPRLLDEKGRFPSLRTVIVSGRRSYTAKGNSILRKSVKLMSSWQPFCSSVHGNQHYTLYTLRGLSPSSGWPLFQIFCPQTTRSRPR